LKFNEQVFNDRLGVCLSYGRWPSAKSQQNNEMMVPEMTLVKKSEILATSFISPPITGVKFAPHNIFFQVGEEKILSSFRQEMS